MISSKTRSWIVVNPENCKLSQRWPLHFNTFYKILLIPTCTTWLDLGMAENGHNHVQTWSLLALLIWIPWATVRRDIAMAIKQRANNTKDSPWTWWLTWIRTTWSCQIVASEVALMMSSILRIVLLDNLSLVLWVKMCTLFWGNILNIYKLWNLHKHS